MRAAILVATILCVPMTAPASAQTFVSQMAETGTYQAIGSRERSVRFSDRRSSSRRAVVVSRNMPVNRVRVRRSLAEPMGQLGYSGDLVSRARSYVGMTAAQIGLHRRTLWCATFMNHITGGGTGSDLARSYLSLRRVAPQVGAIVVLSRGRRGDHVGVVSGFNGRNPIVISGNHNRRVGEGEYPASRVRGYVRLS